MGDLNKDSIPDLVLVKQDTIHKLAPYRIEIYFVEKSGEKQLLVSSDKAIAPQYPDGRDSYRTGDEFAGITIKKGILSIEMQLLRGYFSHKIQVPERKF